MGGKCIKCISARATPPHTRPFWAYSRTLPHWVELLVEPLVKSVYRPLKASPNAFFLRTPLDPPPLETHFFEAFRERGGGGWWVSKMLEKVPPPLFWVKNQESFGFFSSIWSLKNVSGSRLQRVLCGGRGPPSEIGPETAKNVLLFPSRHIVSQHPHSHPSEWVPGGHRRRRNRQHTENGWKVHKMH